MATAGIFVVRYILMRLLVLSGKCQSPEEEITWIEILEIYDKSETMRFKQPQILKTIKMKNDVSSYMDETVGRCENII